MKKQTLLIVTTIFALFAASTMTVHAAPKTMADGVTFDAEYYAKNNPDVVSVYGNTEAKLYDHYKQYGKNEGRKATADSVATKAAATKSTDNSVVATLKTQYPNGTAWNANSSYNVPEAFDGKGCGRKNTGSVMMGSLGWAWLVSNSVQGLNETNLWKYHALISTNKESVKANDVVWLSDSVIYDNGSMNAHVVFVVSVDSANRTFVASEGNYGGTVNWDVTYSFDNISEVWRMEKDGKGQENVWHIVDGVPN